MLLLLAAAVLAASGPSACPSDLMVADPRLKVVRSTDKAFDNYIVTVDVKNDGHDGQGAAIAQRLDLVKDGKVIGTQPIPALGAAVTYPAAFRMQLPHVKKRMPITVTFHYVLADQHDAARENCKNDNDLLTATLQ